MMMLKNAGLEQFTERFTEQLPFFHPAPFVGAE
jgi:hypothetical protein